MSQRIFSVDRMIYSDSTGIRGGNQLVVSAVNVILSKILFEVLSGRRSASLFSIQVLAASAVRAGMFTVSSVYTLTNLTRS